MELCLLFTALMLNGTVSAIHCSRSRCLHRLLAHTVDAGCVCRALITFHFCCTIYVCDCFVRTCFFTILLAWKKVFCRWNVAFVIITVSFKLLFKTVPICVNVLA